MPLLAAADAPPYPKLCKANFLGVVEISDMKSLKVSLILGYEMLFVFDISLLDLVLNMRHILMLSLSLEISNLSLCKYTSKYSTGPHSDFTLEMQTKYPSLW